MDQNGPQRLVVPALILGICLIVSAAFIGNGYKESKPTDIYSKASFSGTAKQTVDSDKAKWSLTLTHTASSSEQALKLVDQDHDALKKLLTDNKITDANYSFHPATVQTYNDYAYDDYGSSVPSKTPTYYADQIVVIESSQAEALGALNENTSYQYQYQSGKTGLQITTRSMEFTYSKLDDLKKDLVKQAINDAHDSAKTLLGDQLGSLRTMDLPTFSVQPESSPTDYYQNSPDTSSIKKTITASVNVDYNLK